MRDLTSRSIASQRKGREVLEKSAEGNKKSVRKMQDLRREYSPSEESGSSDLSEDDFSEGLISDASSSNSESESSSSGSSRARANAGQKRGSSGRKSLSSRVRERSGRGEAARASRYVRQL